MPRGRGVCVIITIYLRANIRQSLFYPSISLTHFLLSLSLARALSRRFVTDAALHHPTQDIAAQLVPWARERALRFSPLMLLPAVYLNIGRSYQST